MNIKWDAEKYTADFSFVHQYGNDVIGLLEKKAGGTVLDLGCGNGALTKALADQGWNAVGLDASKELLSAARNKYPGLSFLEGMRPDFPSIILLTPCFPTRFSTGLQRSASRT